MHFDAFFRTLTLLILIFATTIHGQNDTSHNTSQKMSE